MGNCYPCHFSTIKISGPPPVENKPVPEEAAPRRFGSLGLADCGFEYRQLSVNTSSDEDELPETRLFHKTTRTMISSDNRRTFISDGNFFDEVVQCCQQVAQERIQSVYGLEWMELFRIDGESIYALASPNYIKKPASSNPILMVFTGKGKSRAGILSVRELLISGLERGSAMYHIHQAIKRKWNVVVLDPNARGKMEGSRLIRQSLDHLDWSGHAPVYILSHSAAGGYLVHYLLEGEHRLELLPRIQGLVFTDSTHSIQWTKDDRPVYDLLESPKVLYIRNCSENPSDTFANHKNKKAGEHHEGNHWWIRRFGSIQTVWAGTTDHAAMCWVARKVVWEFFDKRNKETNLITRFDPGS